MFCRLTLYRLPGVGLVPYGGTSSGWRLWVAKLNDRITDQGATSRGARGATGATSRGAKDQGAGGHGPGASSGSSLAKTAIWPITNFQLSHGAI